MFCIAAVEKSDRAGGHVKRVTTSYAKKLPGKLVFWTVICCSSFAVATNILG